MTKLLLPLISLYFADLPLQAVPAHTGGVFGGAATATAAAGAPGGGPRGRVAVAAVRDAAELALPHAAPLLFSGQDVAGEVRLLQGRALF